MGGGGQAAKPGPPPPSNFPGEGPSAGRGQGSGRERRERREGRPAAGPGRRVSSVCPAPNSEPAFAAGCQGAIPLRDGGYGVRGVQASSGVWGRGHGCGVCRASTPPAHRVTGALAPRSVGLLEHGFVPVTHLTQGPSQTPGFGCSEVGDKCRQFLVQPKGVKGCSTVSFRQFNCGSVLLMLFEVFVKLLQKSVIL